MPDVQVKVGVGVIVVKENKVLVGERQGSHGEGLYAFPGGHFDVEDALNAIRYKKPGFWVCSEREAKEETNMIVHCKSIDGFREAVFTTSDIMSEDETRVYSTSYILAEYVHGGEWGQAEVPELGIIVETVKPAEPDKCKNWFWLTLDQVVALWEKNREKQEQWIPLNQVIKYLQETGVR